MKGRREPKDRRPIQFRQLCALARYLLTATPSMSDSEWAEAIKRRVLALEFTYPEDQEAITRAMQQVDRAMVETMGPRPVELPSERVTATKPQQHDPPWSPQRRSKGWELVSDLIDKIQSYGASESSLGRRPEAARDTLDLSEDVVLDHFHHEASVSGGDRIALLRAFAEIAIVRGADWDPERVRAEARDHRLKADRCFGCHFGDRPIEWHHIIQIQRGGSNAARNRVALCAPCHSDIHPWLPPASRRNDAWGHISYIGANGHALPVPVQGSFVPMRTWRQAWSRLTCGFDREHVIAKDDWYLEIEIAPTIKRVRCQTCAVKEHGDPGPPVTAPVAEPVTVATPESESAS